MREKTCGDICLFLFVFFWMESFGVLEEVLQLMLDALWEVWDIFVDFVEQLFSATGDTL